MTPDAMPRPVGRDRFLDLLRAVATVRVVIWHATGAAAVTLVAALPIMCFVTGALFARSAASRGAGRTVVDRVRRLALPLWLFAAVAWAAMAVGAARSGTDLPWVHLPSWFVPLGDPLGSTWEGGWLSTPLWYLRALLWLFLLAPAALWLLRLRPRTTIAASVLAIVVIDAVDSTGALAPAWNDRLGWQLGDLALYGTFFLLGAHVEGIGREGRGWPPPRHGLVLAGAGIGAAAVAWAVAAPLDAVVNNSHVLHLCVGVAWLGVAIALAEPLRRWAAGHGPARVLRVMGRRSMSVYLWHTAAIVVALWVLEGVWSGPARAIALGLLIVALTGAAVLMAGWIEDVAARRRPELWPGSSAWSTGHRLGVVGVVATVVAVLVLGVGLRTSTPPELEVAASPRVPSQAPPRPTMASATAGERAPATGDAVFDLDLDLHLDRPLDREQLEAVAQAWARDRGLPGIGIAIGRPGQLGMAVATGVQRDGSPRTIDDELDVMSVTKLFTANLVYRAVDEGLIDLDAPLPPIAALPDLPSMGTVTPRQLLSHRSGFVNYRDTSAYRAEPTSVVGPIEAVVLAVNDPDVAAPGSAKYSSTNFLILGYLLEQVTGRDYDDLLRADLFEPLGLVATKHLPSEPGEPRFSTAGIVTTLDDLLRAGGALLRDHVGITDAAYHQMAAFDVEAAMGAGTMGYCPCETLDDGTTRAFAVGYAGGSTFLAYLPGPDLVVAADVTGGFVDSRFDDLMALLQRLAAAPIGTQP